MDDLLIISKSRESMSHLIDGLRNRYGIITLSHGPTISYLGMSIDMHVRGQAMITMKGYSAEVVKTSGVQGTAKSPATDGLFETREDAAMMGELTRVWFHRVVPRQEDQAGVLHSGGLPSHKGKQVHGG